MGLKATDIIVALAINFFQYAYSDYFLPCNTTTYGICPEHEFCNETSSVCECDKGFVRVEDECEPPGENTSSGNGATAALVTIFTIVLICSGLFLVVRKYNLIEYIRQKINLRRNHNVMYEDVMIGNDDPPLSL